MSHVTSSPKKAPGEFPLLAAASAPQEAFPSVLQVLLTARADVNQAKQDDIQDTTLTMAAAFGLGSVAIELCKSRADVNKATATGATPMLIAADHEYPSLVDLLGAYRADPNKATKEGMTSLALAARNGNVDVLKHLLKYRADVNYRCSEARVTPLMLAAEQGHTAFAQRFLVPVGAKCSCFCGLSTAGSTAVISLFGYMLSYLSKLFHELTS